MLCSPSHLFIDLTVWYSPGFYEQMVASFQNLSDNQDYDCGLTSVPCDSNITRQLVTFDTSVFRWFDILVVYGLLSVITVIGILGNVVNVIIFSTCNIASDSTNILLLALSVSDLFNLLDTGVILINCFLCFLDEAMAVTTYNVVFPHASLASRWLSLLSLDFVAAISLQRACAVVFPFKVAAIFSGRNTRILTAVLFFLAFCSMLVINVGMYPRWLFHPYFDQTISLGYSYRVDYQFIIDYITLYLSPRSGIDLVLISVTGTLTVFKLKIQAQNRSTLKAGPVTPDAGEKKISSREATAIKMSLTVCFVTFIIYSLVIIANGIIQLQSHKLFKSHLPIMNMYSIFVVISIGSAFNFFLYMIMSPKYRSVVGNWFRAKEARE